MPRKPYTLAIWSAILGVLAIWGCLNPVGTLAAITAVVCGLLALIKLLIALFSRANQADDAFSLVPVIALAIGIAAGSFAILVPVSAFLEAQVRARVARARTRLEVSAERFQQSLSATTATSAVIVEHDPFAQPPDDTMKVQSKANGAFAIWSIGPDRLDQQGAFSYDSTNGTVSPGDLVVTGTLKGF